MASAISQSRLGRAVAAGAAFVVGIAGLGVQIRVPPDAILRALPDPAALDYSFGRQRGFEPLRDSYIRDVLGGVLPASAHGDRPRGGPLGGGGWGPPLTVPRLSIAHPLTNDTMATAKVVPSVPYTAHTNTAGAHREAGEPDGCGSLGDTVWYRYTPPRDIGLHANTFGTDHATALGVFESGVEQPIGCRTNARGNALVTFPARRGQTYLFQVASPAGGGDLVFNLDPVGSTQVLEGGEPSDPGGPMSGMPTLSEDGRMLVFASEDPRYGVSPVPCATGPPEGTSAAIYYRGYYAGPAGPFRAGPAMACLQVVALDLETGVSTVASVSDAGHQADAHVLDYMVSGDGRFVTFSTHAGNLVTGDTNALADVFVHDLRTRKTERVSVSTRGDQTYRGAEDLVSSGDSRTPSISHDGRYVFFESSAPNLSGKPTTFTGQWVDVYVHDRRNRTTELVSLNSTGERAKPAYGIPWNAETAERWATLNTRAAFPCISSNARYAVFRSRASNIDPRARDGSPQLFLRDMVTGRTELVSVSDSGDPVDGDVYPSLQARANWTRPVRTCVSDDGRSVAFMSNARNIDPSDRAEAYDVFVRDRVAGRTKLISASPHLVDPYGIVKPSEHPELCAADDHTETPVGNEVCFRGGGEAVALSSNGRYVAFDSYDFVHDGDDNGGQDVYLYDLHTDTVTRVSLDPSGRSLRSSGTVQLPEHFFNSATATQGHLRSPAISATGGVIAFEGYPFVSQDERHNWTLYVHRRVGNG